MRSTAALTYFARQEGLTFVTVSHMTLQLSGKDSPKLQPKVAADTYTLEKDTSLPLGAVILNKRLRNYDNKRFAQLH